MMVLVRHALSVANKARVMSGMEDVAASPEGLDQVRVYRTQGLYPLTERHYSSPLRRCRETFQAAYGPAVRLDGIIDAFHEVSFGSLEGRGLSDQDLMRLWQSWVEGTEYAASFGVEPFTHARERGVRAVGDLARQCADQGVATVTVVTHSGLMRSAIAGLAGLGYEGWCTLSVPNGLGYALDLTVDEDRVGLVRATPLDPKAGPDKIVLPQGVGGVQ